MSVQFIVSMDNQIIWHIDIARHRERCTAPSCLTLEGPPSSLLTFMDAFYWMLRGIQVPSLVCEYHEVSSNKMMC